MIVDSSALVALVKEETSSEAVRYALSIAREPVQMSASTYLECSIVLDSLPEHRLHARLDDLIQVFNIILVPFTFSQALIARQAYRDYGKGSGHRAKLNFGDCFAYALATEMREPILCVGDDFVYTDLRVIPLIEPPNDLG